MRLGIDVGSTTVKLILLDDNDKIIYSRYERHMSNVFETVVELIRKMYEEMGDMKKYGLKEYGAYYVPAVEERYISNMPLWDGSFN